MTEVYDFAAIGAEPARESAAELAAFYGLHMPTAPRNLEVVLSTGAKFQPDTILFAAGRVPTAFDAFRRLCNDGPYDPSVRDHIVPSYET